MILIATKTGVLVSGPIQLLKIRWIGPLVAGNTLILNDSNGNLAWQESYETGASTPESDFSTDLESFNGLTVAQIDGGTLVVYGR